MCSGVLLERESGSSDSGNGKIELSAGIIFVAMTFGVLLLCRVRIRHSGAVIVEWKTGWLSDHFLRARSGSTKDYGEKWFEMICSYRGMWPRTGKNGGSIAFLRIFKHQSSLDERLHNERRSACRLMCLITRHGIRVNIQTKPM